MIKSIGIVGSGLIGRLLAHRLIQDGYQAHIFDRDDERGKLSCGWVGAGMLAPYSELDSAEEPIFTLGKESLSWPGIIASLVKPVFFQQVGTLIVAHSQDRTELSRLQQNIERKLANIFAQSGLDRSWGVQCHNSKVAELEPELSSRFHDALYIADEGQVDNRQLFDALTCTLKASGAPWHCGVNVIQIEPGRIRFVVDSGEELQPHSGLGETHLLDEEAVSRDSTKYNAIEQRFDLVIDTRGLNAKTDLPQLRGVRGELIRVLAPEVALHRPIRVMHPRYPLYVVPRPDHHYLIGATSIESESDAPITVQSALELLSAAFSIHTGFAEASILEMQARCRPALVDNAPKIYLESGLMRINGLYRHGFLMAPKLVDLAVSLIKNDLQIDSRLAIEPTYKPIIVENVDVRSSTIV